VASLTPLGCLAASYLFIVRVFLLSPFLLLQSSLLLLLSSGNRTAKLVPIPFCSRDLPESYLLLFFSPTFFLHPCCVQTLRDPAGNSLQHLSCVTRGLTDTLPLQHLDFPIGDVQRKQTGAMFDHLSLSAQV
jgi:hypothetical protein